MKTLSLYCGVMFISAFQFRFLINEWPMACIYEAFVSETHCLLGFKTNAVQNFLFEC